MSSDTPTREQGTAPSTGNFPPAKEGPEDPIIAFETAMRKLREPFPESAVGLLPRAVRKGDQDRMDCEPRNGRKVSIDGRYCHGYHPLSLHLDYVGHAATTDRLLQVDPRWNWEPVAVDEFGLPMLDRSGGLWIRLTVAGVTRLGYGDAPGKSGAMKELIGDALRNAAMRFGVALDLWSKEDLHAADEERGTEQMPSDARGGSSQANRSNPARPTGSAPPSPQAGAQRAELPPIEDEVRDQWRRQILSREYLGNAPAKGEPRDGGLRWAYKLAKEAGVLPYSIAPNDETTFVQLFQRLSSELPERPNESTDAVPADETGEQRREREIAEAERDEIRRHEAEADRPMALGDDSPSGWGSPENGEAGGGAWSR